MSFLDRWRQIAAALAVLVAANMALYFGFVRKMVRESGDRAHILATVLASQISGRT